MVNHLSFDYKLALLSGKSHDIIAKKIHFHCANYWDQGGREGNNITKIARPATIEHSVTVVNYVA